MRYKPCAACGKAFLGDNVPHYTNEHPGVSRGVCGPCWEAWFEDSHGRPPAFKGTR